ncbi:MAG: NAD(P)-dependent oxidoreductase [Mycoplasmatales bacterium]
MKIGVICANGKAGRLIVKEAKDRGINVTAIVRKANETVADKVIQKDLFELTEADLQGFDVIINAFGTWKEDTLPLYSTTLSHLCNLLANTKIRLIIVGGAGSLYVDSEHTKQLFDGAEFPKEIKPLALAAGKSLNELRLRKDVIWTYVSPAIDFQVDGTRSGTYLLGGEELTLNNKGESFISYADYAIAIIDEAINGNNFQKRISVVAQ